MCLLRGTHWIFIYNSTFSPHSVFMCFVRIWEQTAIISLYSINWLVFITETECVYCAVLTGSLYIILRSGLSTASSVLPYEQLISPKMCCACSICRSTVCKHFRKLQFLQSKCLSIVTYALWYIINPLNTKRRLFYLKTQSVPRSKHFSSRL